MIALLFANGNLDPSPQLHTLLGQVNLVIAADGGADHCTRLDITPDILLGDLDSIDAATLTAYQNEGITIKRYPTGKDATDLELALDLAIAKGAKTVWLIAALGGRWDMSLANIMLAAAEKYAKQEICLLGRDCTMRILHPGKEWAINGSPGQRVSLVPIKGDVHGVTLTGFEYPLIEHTILFGSTLGISNVMQNDLATVQHTGGILLCILFRAYNFP